MSMEAKMKAAEVRSVIEGKKDEILEQVKTRLAKFLPSWQPQQTEITFKIMEDADYRHPSKGRVDVDLWRLSFQEDPVGDIVQGIIHELFHEWMSDGEQRTIKDEDNFTSREEAQASASFKISDEGLAVLIGGQSLETHHKMNAEDYAKLVSESFRFLRDYVALEDIDALKRLYRKGLDNMGPFYVVGYEMASKILEHVGMTRFRELVVLIREDANLLFEEYKAIPGGYELPSGMSRDSIHL